MFFLGLFNDAFNLSVYIPIALLRNTRKILRTTEDGEGYKQWRHKLGRISDAQPSAFSVQSAVPYELQKWTVMCEIY
jgi:hypothetical protein